ncbi:MAG: histidine phosphatase family protein [Microbacteriaceae bacterium]|nr:histidine phosphatase family protein [Burkholderiaceae bacterium]
MRLWLARHAAPLVVPGLCYGASDVAADPALTCVAAERLAAALPQHVIVQCSPLQRCHALAAALHDLRPDLLVQTNPLLAEMDFGDWEGQLWTAIGKSALAAWTDDFAQHQPGGGESVMAFMQRVATAWSAASAAAAPDSLWITHAGVIKAARLLAKGHREIERADQWPTEIVAFGEWTTLPLPIAGLPLRHQLNS